MRRSRRRTGPRARSAGRVPPKLRSRLRRRSRRQAPRLHPRPIRRHPTARRFAQLGFCRRCGLCRCVPRAFPAGVPLGLLRSRSLVLGLRSAPPRLSGGSGAGRTGRSAALTIEGQRRDQRQRVGGLVAGRRLDAALGERTVGAEHAQLADRAPGAVLDDAPRAAARSARALPAPEADARARARRRPPRRGSARARDRRSRAMAPGRGRGRDTTRAPPPISRPRAVQTLRSRTRARLPELGDAAHPMPVAARARAHPGNTER